MVCSLSTITVCAHTWLAGKLLAGACEGNSQLAAMVLRYKRLKKLLKAIQAALQVLRQHPRAGESMSTAAHHDYSRNLHALEWRWLAGKSRPFFADKCFCAIAWTSLHSPLSRQPTSGSKLLDIHNHHADISVHCPLNTSIVCVRIDPSCIAWLDTVA
jgi:predicted component of type VI protein secretion system